MIGSRARRVLDIKKFGDSLFIVRLGLECLWFSVGISGECAQSLILGLPSEIKPFIEFIRVIMSIFRFSVMGTISLEFPPAKIFMGRLYLLL